MTRINFPPLPPESLALTQALRSHIDATITERNGWIPFSSYMEQVLYTARLGYYASSGQKFGSRGDFTTAPEMTPLFGHTLAIQLAQLLPHTSGILYEFGAGTGRLGADILQKLAQLNSLPSAYVIIDLSADLIERQRQTLAECVPQYIDRIRWQKTLPDSLEGIIIGNEVLDAMPCELIHWTPTPLHRGVTLKNGELTWEDRPIADPILAERAQALTPGTGYVSEISLTQAAFLHTLAARLTRGAILLIDYGFPEAEYYHPERHMGTLIGHYRHHTIHDPFFLPGLVDLTAHVDFTTLAKAGIATDLDLIGYTSQAHFLVNCGITSELEQLEPAHYLPAVSATQRLLAPSEMGELVKVIGFGKKLPIDWLGFTHGDRCHRL